METLILEIGNRAQAADYQARADLVGKVYQQVLEEIGRASCRERV